MDRWDWMFVRAAMPAVALGGALFFLALKLKALQVSPIFGGLAAWAPWVASAGLVGAALLLVMASWRFWRWERGEGPTCHRCHGPLGAERLGRYGAYRRCLGCRGNCSARHYNDYCP